MGKLADVLLLEEYRRRPQYWVETEGGAAIPAPGETDVEQVLAWARYRAEDSQRWIVAKSTIAGMEVSTVFLGIDHNWGLRGPPILYETMIFIGTEVAEWQWRYCTRESALEGHRTICEAILTETDLDSVRVER